MPIERKKIALDNIKWGILLWLFGYILGFVFFAFVLKDMIGWWIMPLGITATLWVLLKKIKRESFTCYIGVGVFWALIAVLFDYIFLVRLLKATDYYKIDVYLYYFLTLTLPITVGWYRLKRLKRKN